MAAIERDIVAQVYAAKAASEAADALIRQYMGFIRSEAMKTTKKSYGENEDVTDIQTSSNVIITRNTKEKRKR